MGDLLNELKRRNVWRVGAAYVVVAWLLAQAAEMILPVYEAPVWVLKVVFTVLGLGLPLALFFAWAFELTPEGVKKTEDVDPSTSVTSSTGQKLNYLTIAFLVIAVAWFAWDRQALKSQVESSGNTPASVATDTKPDEAAPDRSIAVLPFINMSSDQDQEWFADGLTEEILNALVRASDLKVAARTSSFKFKGSQEDVPTIAAALGVGHVLEGSVRRGGDRIRVTAQLIRANDGFHLWSQTYDSTLDDVITIQEDVSIAIAKALKTAMDPEALAEMANVGTRSVAAYEDYLEGLAIIARVGADEDTRPDATRIASQRFDEAREIDPGFATAHMKAAEFWLAEAEGTTINSGISGLDPVLIKANYLARIDGAISAAGDSPRGALYRGQKAAFDYRFLLALEQVNAYLAEYPNDIDALYTKTDLLTKIDWQNPDLMVTIDHRNALNRKAGESGDEVLSYLFAGAIDKAVAEARERIRSGSNSTVFLYQAHRALLWGGNIEEARAILARLSGADFPADNKLLAQLRQACAGNDTKLANAVWEQLRLVQTGFFAWLPLTILGQKEAAHDAIVTSSGGDPEKLNRSISALLTYPWFDVSDFPEFEAMLAAQGIHRPAPPAVPYACKSEST